MANNMRPKSKAKTAFGLLSEIRQLIVDEPKRYDQFDTLTIRQKDNAQAFDFPACGTIGCVAGWVTALKSRRPALIGPMSYASRVLGLNEQQADELFDDGAAGRTKAQTVEHAEAGAAHIRRFQVEYRKQLIAKRVSK